MSSHELPAIIHVTERVTQVHADLTQKHATVLEAGRLRSQIIGSDPTRATKLTADQGHAITDVGDLQAEAFQLAYALRAIQAKGSAQGVVIRPAGKRPTINLYEDLSAGTTTDELKAPKSITSK